MQTHATAPSPTCPTSPTTRSPPRSATPCDHGWPVSVEYTDDPHPRNVYWEMWGLPMFDLAEPDGVLPRSTSAGRRFPNHYVRVLAYDAQPRPADDRDAASSCSGPPRSPASGSTAQEGPDRTQRYAVTSYATKPTGERTRPVRERP